jgi:addiction module HigA family antidote
MKNPPHPGEMVFKECIEPLGLTITDAARGLGVTRNYLSRLIHGYNGISPEMAVRLSMAFGSSAEMWLRMQNAYDLAQIQKKTKQMDVHKFERAW